MRLLIVTFDPPENVGGIEGRVRGYVTELTKRGSFVEIEAFAPGYSFSNELFFGARIHKCSSSPRALLRSLRYTIRLAQKQSIDSVFLLSGGITIFGNLLLLYCRIRRKKTAILLYGKDILQARKSALSRVLLFSSQLLADRIATNSHFTASLLPAYFRRKITQLFPSVDSNLQDSEDLKRSTATGIILFVGRLVKRKGVDDLINAFSLLSNDLPAARLEIVGDGPERQALEALVKTLGLSDKVTFYGTLKGDALQQRYEECDLVVMPSRTMRDDVEGFGTVFLEAGLRGRPSVGTFSGGIPEAVTNGVTGLLVREGDVHELSVALGRLLTDENLREQLGNNARSRVLSEFTWNVTTTRLQEIFQG